MLAITDNIRGSSREKNYQELGLESLQHRRWYRKLCYFYKIYNAKSPDYLFQLIPPKKSSYTTRNADNIPFFKFRHNFFQNSFFPSTIIEWNKLAPDLRNSDSFSAFKKSILNFIRPSPNSIFNCHNPKALKFITRLRLGLSHLHYHKFKHNFQASLNPLCKCVLITETTSHYLLHSNLFAGEEKTFLSNIKSINHKFLEQSDSTLTQMFLFGDPASSVETNTLILNAKIQYVLRLAPQILFLKREYTFRFTNFLIITLCSSSSNSSFGITSLLTQLPEDLSKLLKATDVRTL